MKFKRAALDKFQTYIQGLSTSRLEQIDANLIQYNELLAAVATSEDRSNRWHCDPAKKVQILDRWFWFHQVAEFIKIKI